MIQALNFTTLIECYGGDGSGRYFSELRPDWIKRAGATNVPRDVGNANNLINRSIGAYNVRYSICDYLRDSRHTSLGRYRDG